MSTIFSQQILSSRLLLFVIDGQKNNLTYRFKLELITTYTYDLLWKYCGCSTLRKNKEN